MKNYYRVMLGKGSKHAAECFKDGFIGADFGINEDLAKNLPEEWREFNKKYIPVYLKINPKKTRIGAGLACGALWTVCKGIKPGDTVLSPDGEGNYRVGQVTGGYHPAPGAILPHRRKVAWQDKPIARADMSEPLQNSTGSIGTVSNITKHQTEIETLIGTLPATPSIKATTDEVEDPYAFAMEKHLEEFLAANWKQTLLSKEYDIFEEDGEVQGKQYATDAGTIDILAVSKNKKRLLVVELKRGRASDAVVGQVLRYMGYVKEQLAEDNQTVEGAIIALEDDQKLRWAISQVPSIQFYRYEVKFELKKG